MAFRPRFWPTPPHQNTPQKGGGGGWGGFKRVSSKCPFYGGDPSPYPRLKSSSAGGTIIYRGGVFYPFLVIFWVFWPFFGVFGQFLGFLTIFRGFLTPFLGFLTLFDPFLALFDPFLALFDPKWSFLACGKTRPYFGHFWLFLMIFPTLRILTLLCACGWGLGIFSIFNRIGS